MTGPKRSTLNIDPLQPWLTFKHFYLPSTHVYTHHGEARSAQVWAHRNALSGFFRYVGRGGWISRDQVRWSLEALNSLVKGDLLQARLGVRMKGQQLPTDPVLFEKNLCSTPGWTGSAKALFRCRGQHREDRECSQIPRRPCWWRGTTESFSISG